MEWNLLHLQSVYEAVDRKSGGNAGRFLSPHRDYKIQNRDVMAAWLSKYAQMGCPITVIGDYDVDGVTATASLYLALRELGARNIRIRLPKRMSEGYGLKEQIVDEVQGGVIVTVDNGIAALDAVRKAKEKGLVVLVIDHHLPPVRNGAPAVPCADLIVDPCVPDGLIAAGGVTGTTFRGYCGCGLVYKIAQAMIPGTRTLDMISAFAAIATVADVMPLTEDNRNIYWDGIGNIRKGNMTVGLQALIGILQSGNIVTEGDIGFKIAPMINAPGRIYDDGAMKSLSAALATNRVNASFMASALSADNATRIQMKEEAVRRAYAIINQNHMHGQNPVVIADPQTPEGIVGLVAGVLKEKLNATAIVFTEKDGMYKGSARGADKDDLKMALDRVYATDPDIFAGYGGHKKAAGVTIHKDALQRFAWRMHEELGAPEPPAGHIDVDIEIAARDIQSFAAEVQKFAPFGEANPAPIFCIRGFKLVPQDNTFYRELKNGGLKFVGAGCEAVGFDVLGKYRALGCPLEVDLVGTLGYNYYLGKGTPQVEIMDLRASNSQRTRSSFQMALEQSLKNYGLTR